VATSEAKWKEAAERKVRGSENRGREREDWAQGKLMWVGWLAADQ
jgi:hypothetical protein